MIFGDPYRFAIHCDLVTADWAVPDNVDGVFAFWVDGKVFPDQISPPGLWNDFEDLRDGALVNPFRNDELFGFETQRLFSVLLKASHPGTVFQSHEEFARYPADLWEDADERYSASTSSLDHAQYKLFAVSNADSVRLIMGPYGIRFSEEEYVNLSLIDIADIWETTIPIAELEIIVANALSYLEGAFGKKQAVFPAT